jgi:hypothetical protein
MPIPRAEATEIVSAKIVIPDAIAAEIVNGTGTVAARDGMLAVTTRIDTTDESETITTTTTTTTTAGEVAGSVAKKPLPEMRAVVLLHRRQRRESRLLT